MIVSDDSEQDTYSRVEDAASIGWWRASFITARAFAVTREMSICPPDEYGVVRRFLVLVVQKYDPYTGKRNWLLLISFALFSIPMLLVTFAVIGNAGFFYGMITYLIFSLLMLFILAASYTAFFRSGGWEKVLEVRGESKRDRQQRRVHEARSGQPL